MADLPGSSPRTVHRNQRKPAHANNRPTPPSPTWPAPSSSSTMARTCPWSASASGRSPTTWPRTRSTTPSRPATASLTAPAVSRRGNPPFSPRGGFLGNASRAKPAPQRLEVVGRRGGGRGRSSGSPSNRGPSTRHIIYPTTPPSPGRAAPSRAAPTPCRLGVSRCRHSARAC